MSTPAQPDRPASDERGSRSRTRVIVGVLLAALVVAVGAVIGRWQTRPPADDPGPDDPVRRSSRPW